MQRWRVGPATLWVEDGIVFHTLEPGSVLRLDDVKAVAAKIDEVAPHQPVPVIGIHERAASVDAAARRYSSTPEMTRRCAAVAVVTDSQVMRVLVNFFLRFSKPPYPVRIFRDLDEAVDWAKRYVQR